MLILRTYCMGLKVFTELAARALSIQYGYTTAIFPRQFYGRVKVHYKQRGYPSPRTAYWQDKGSDS
jgi:hypothetical protein